MTNKLQISYCIGIYNEEKIVKKSILALQKTLLKMLGKNNFEILLVNNGSTDNTEKIVSSIKIQELTYLSIPEKGHGAALRHAILNAKYEHIVVTAIDLPFGFQDLEQYLRIHQKYDIVFGSKAHPLSKYNSKLERKTASLLYRYLLLLLFGLKIKDPQGSIFAKRKKLLTFIKLCDARNAFFTTQIAIRGKKEKYKMIEIPVTTSKEKRKSKYKIVKDGRQMLRSLLKEAYRFHFKESY